MGGRPGGLSRGHRIMTRSLTLFSLPVALPTFGGMTMARPGRRQIVGGMGGVSPVGGEPAGLGMYGRGSRPRTLPNRLKGNPGGNSINSFQSKGLYEILAKRLPIADPRPFARGLFSHTLTHPSRSMPKMNAGTDLLLANKGDRAILFRTPLPSRHLRRCPWVALACRGGNEGNFRSGTTVPLYGPWWGRMLG